jgi:hypothetical protein
VIPYEKRLDGNLRWAFTQGSLHFEKANEVHETMRRVTRRLAEMGVPYAVTGVMAMFYHGVRRFTEDVDILVTREGLRTIHDRLGVLDCVPESENGRSLRDKQSGVRVDFFVAGDHPGNGKPIPVTLPDPAEASVVIEGVRFLTLPRLVESKLASGMRNPGSLIHLADAQRIIETRDLPQEFAERLNPFVRDKYQELWAIVHSDFPGSNA